MAQQIIQRISPRLKTIKCLQSNSLLKVVIYFSIICHIVVTISGCDSSTTAVLSNSSTSLQLNVEVKKDSAQIIGTESEIMAVFRRVRDEMKEGFNNI